MSADICLLPSAVQDIFEHFTDYCASEFGCDANMTDSFLAFTEFLDKYWPDMLPAAKSMWEWRDRI